LTGAFDELWEMAREAFDRSGSWCLGRRFSLSLLSSLGRKTLAGLICSQGAQFEDWSRSYRLFEKKRFDKDKLLDVSRRAICDRLPNDMPVLAAMDDTLLYKSGKKIAGTSWRRDPLGPKFRPNFVWANRWVQTSVLVPENGFESGARAIPVDIAHAPTPRKPRKGADEETWKEYRREQKRMNVSQVGLNRMRGLREKLNCAPATKERQLVMAVDGGYTNNTIFGAALENTTVIGRIRKDAKLFAKPEQIENAKGRKRVYGDVLPTPEQIRQDETIQWQSVKAFAAGQSWDFDVKIVTPVRWKSAPGRDLQLVVVRPIALRPTKGGRLQYREPAYILCTDPSMPVQELLQAYLWRWEIEGNFRDEKTAIGVGDPQVRTQTAVENTTAFAVASYAMLQTAAILSGIADTGLPLPKWRTAQPPKRCSTNQLIARLRAELWGKALGIHFSGFETNDDRRRTLQNAKSGIMASVFTAST
jgi:hypothetical protein